MVLGGAVVLTDGAGWYSCADGWCWAEQFVLIIDGAGWQGGRDVSVSIMMDCRACILRYVLCGECYHGVCVEIPSAGLV